MVNKTTISILEGNALYRTLLIRMIKSINGYALESVYEGLESASEQLFSPSDILIMDLECDGEEKVFDFMHSLLKKESIQLIACSLKEEDSLIRKAIYMGVNGYVIKESSYDEFRANLMLALSGGIPMSRAVVKKLVDVVRRDFTTAPIAKLSAAISLSCDIIEEILARPFSLQRENLSDHLSRRVGQSYHHLSLQFKREMGITLNQYFLVKKIERVKAMIREDEHTITQIANMLDYSSVAHLSSQFRKITGITPSEYKRAFDAATS